MKYTHQEALPAGNADHLLSSPKIEAAPATLGLIGSVIQSIRSRAQKHADLNDLLTERY